ncbi:MAG: hypothetical protein ACRD1G_01185, partial [Acidimicrobiales bacterium]
MSTRVVDVAVLAGSTVVTPTGLLEPGRVELEGGVIVSVEPTQAAVPERILAPGMVDIQVNGCVDVDVASAHGSDW